MGCVALGKDGRVTFRVLSCRHSRSVHDEHPMPCSHSGASTVCQATCALWPHWRIVFQNVASVQVLGQIALPHVCLPSARVCQLMCKRVAWASAGVPVRYRRLLFACIVPVDCDRGVLVWRAPLVPMVRLGTPCNASVACSCCRLHDPWYAAYDQSHLSTVRFDCDCDWTATGVIRTWITRGIGALGSRYTTYHNLPLRNSTRSVRVCLIQSKS